MAERARKRPYGPGEHGQRVEWRKWKQQKKEEKQKWKGLKMTKKLERQRAQEEQAKHQQEEEAAAQSEERGEQAGSWAGQRRAERPLGATGPRHLVLMEKLRLREWEGPKKLSPNLLT